MNAREGIHAVFTTVKALRLLLESLIQSLSSRAQRKLYVRCKKEPQKMYSLDDYA